MATAWLFPGQGSQHKGMGLELFERFPDHMALADRVLGWSIAELCRHNEGGLLNRTDHAQPALFVCSALAFSEARSNDGEPDFLAGHSLGELVALHAAGAFDFETGLRLVARRGQLMNQADNGSMAAVLGLSEPEVEELLAANDLTQLEIANANAPQQLVVSGASEQIKRLVSILRRAERGRAVPLMVSAAFHSSHMVEAARLFAQELERYRFRPLEIPVVANATGRLYDDATAVETLSAQVRSRVRWWESMMLLRQAGVEEAVQLGPGDVLGKLWAEARQAEIEPALPTATGPRSPVGVATSSAVETVTVLKVPAPGPDRAPSAVDGRRSSNRRSAHEVNGPARGEGLGSPHFCRRHGVDRAYASGSMFGGIASVGLVRRMAEAGMLAFYGSGGHSLSAIETAAGELERQLPPGAPWGMNLLAGPDNSNREQQIVDLYLRRGVEVVEASAYTSVSPALVEYRFKGATIDGVSAVARRRVVAKVSRLHMAEAFLSPPSDEILRCLHDAGRLSREEVSAARRLPVAADICIESDSGGHTDSGTALALLPTVIRLRDQLEAALGLDEAVCIGAAGGLGCPEAVAAAFVMGADFVVTGSVNQCTVEAGTSSAVKDLLAGLSVHDTTTAPAGDLFELGAKVQVVRKGTLFAARANQLYQWYRAHDSVEELTPEVRGRMESFFGRTVDGVWSEVGARLSPTRRVEVEANPKRHLAQIMRWYFEMSMDAALSGAEENKVNFQIHSGPAMGAFNRWVRGGRLEAWNERHVDLVADQLIGQAHMILTNRR